MKAVVSEKGQVTIPKQLRDRLGIRPGEVLEFEEDGGRLVAVKQQRRAPVDSVYGILRVASTTDELITQLRGPAELP
ncbi:MAG TPA: AbrB/MazE/SpoVT family DNA-binding domain-containing protein [Pseudonocardiaceae bacterium]|nr:AbrB/MazE/SpoVT family DNA-binding domain-containing protein [Pseudonocardiaceae bacterium]